MWNLSSPMAAPITLIILISPPGESHSLLEILSYTSLRVSPVTSATLSIKLSEKPRRAMVQSSLLCLLRFSSSLSLSSPLSIFIANSLSISLSFSVNLEGRFLRVKSISKPTRKPGTTRESIGISAPRLATLTPKISVSRIALATIWSLCLFASSIARLVNHFPISFSAISPSNAFLPNQISFPVASFLITSGFASPGLTRTNLDLPCRS